MAVQISGFNIGADARFSVTDNFGDVFIDSDMGYLEDFETQATSTNLKITPITTGGVPINQVIWNGGMGSLSFTRFGPSFQQMFLDLMASYYGLGTIPQFSMALQVRNRDGSTDEYLYTGVQFASPHFGRFQALRDVKMSARFDWSTCQGTGNLTAFLAGLALAA